MADGISASTTISLIEEVYGVVPNNSTRSTKTLCLIVSSRRYLTYPAPTLQIVTLGNTNVPPLPISTVVRRNTIIHQVSATMIYYNRILGKECTRTSIITINELICQTQLATEQETKQSLNTIRFH